MSNDRKIIEKWCEIHQLKLKELLLVVRAYDPVTRIDLAELSGAGNIRVWIRNDSNKMDYYWKILPCRNELMSFKPDDKGLCCVKNDANVSSQKTNDGLNWTCRKCGGRAYHGAIMVDCPRCGKY